MTCNVCGYEWCWTCGLAKDHYMHRIQYNMICNILNGLTLGFEANMHWILRYALTLLLIVSMPIILFVFFTACVCACLGKMFQGMVRR